MDNILEYKPINYRNESENLNLENPIFVYYTSIKNLPLQRAKEEISNIYNLFNYSNVTVWIVPNHEKTSIECIWKGSKVEQDEKAN